MTLTLSPDIARTYSQNIIHTPHKLCETGVFNRQGLITLIEETPDSDLKLYVGAPETQDTENLPTVQRNGRSGAEILALLETHKVWLGIANVHQRSETYNVLIGSLFSNLKKQTRLWINRPRAMLIISSKGVKTPYHCDLQEHSMWQIFGTQKAFVYPRGEAFLSHEDIDNHILNNKVTYENYTSASDSAAKQVELSSGYMLSWPFMSPHRLVTESPMSVALQIEYMTPTIWARYIGMIATTILRQYLGLKIIPSAQPKDRNFATTLLT